MYTKLLITLCTHQTPQMAYSSAFERQGHNPCQSYRRLRHDINAALTTSLFCCKHWPSILSTAAQDNVACLQCLGKREMPSPRSVAAGVTFAVREGGKRRKQAAQDSRHEETPSLASQALGEAHNIVADAEVTPHRLASMLVAELQLLAATLSGQAVEHRNGHTSDQHGDSRLSSMDDVKIYMDGTTRCCACLQVNSVR